MGIDFSQYFDFILLFVSIVLLLIGFVGCVVPVIPGPLLSWLSILCIWFTDQWGHFGASTLVIWGVLMIGVTVLDYIVPIIGTKKFGGTKQGAWGATIGLIIGLFMGPIGIIIGPFLGAFIGEKLNDNVSTEAALHAALGSFIGMLGGIVLKLAVSFGITVAFLRIIF